MHKKFLLLLLISLFFASPLPSFAKEWDPQLLEASKTAYAGKPQEALAMIEEYIKSHPLDPNGLFVKAVILDWKANLNAEPERQAQLKIVEVYEEASDMAFQLWNRDKDNVDKMIDLGNGYLFLARKYSEVGSWFKAVLTGKKCQQHLEKALKLDPNRVDGLLALGGFHYLADNVPAGAAPFKALLGIHGTKAQGMAELKRALTGTHPFVLDTQYSLFVLYSDFEKNYDEALKTLSGLEQQFPNNPDFKFKKAQVYQKQDKQKGIGGFLNLAQWCEAAAGRCHPSYLYNSYYNAGRLYRELNQPEKMKPLLAKALTYETKLNPNRSAEMLLWLAQADQAEGHVPTALEKLQQAKAISGTSGNIKKEIDSSIENACKIQKVDGKC